MKNGFTWLLVGLILAMLLGQWLERSHLSGAFARPDEALSTLTRQHPDLGPALAAADRADLQPLITWLVRASALQRQSLAQAVLGASMQNAPPGPDGKPMPDDRTGWAARYRLLAFLRVGTGQPELDHELDNVLAYTLVMGNATVAPNDLLRASEIADRMEHQLRVEPQHGRFDTLGCVRFHQGLWAKSKEAFARANELLAKESATEAGHPLLVKLYKARLDAAAFNLNPPPNAALHELPRDLRP
jgi:hypothetical protein